MKKLPLLFLLISTITVFGQRQVIDSTLTDLRLIEKMPPSLERDTLSSKKFKRLMYHYTFINADSALYYTKQLLAIAEKRHIETNIIHCYNYFGYLYGLEGNHFMAAQNYYKALGMAVKNNDEKKILNSKRLLAGAYIYLEDYDKALKFGQEALVLSRKRKDNNEILASLSNLGVIELNQKKFGKAKSTFQEMQELATKLDDKDFIVVGLNSLGKVESEMKNYDKAYVLFNDLQKKYEPNSINYATTQIDIAAVLVGKKQYAKAIPLILDAQKIIRKEGGESYLPTSFKLLYESFKAQGNSTEALKYHEKFMMLSDSLSTESTQSRIRSLQFEYDNTLKESQLQKQSIELLEEKTQKQQISQTRNLFLLGGVLAVILAGILFWNNRKLNLKNQLIESQKTQIMLAQEQLENANQNLEFRVKLRTQELAFANEEVSQKNEEIKTALYTGQSIERKRVAAELHDNLSSILSAVNMSMQAISGKTLSEGDQKIYKHVREMIKTAYTEVRNISHNIMPAGLEKDGLLVTIQQLLDKINLSKQIAFQLQSKGMEQRLPLEIELNAYSVVLELINNIIKHSEATQATISMVNEGDYFSLKIKDNGIGLQEVVGGDTNHGSKDNGIGLQKVVGGDTNHGGEGVVGEDTNHGNYSNSGNGMTNMKTRIEALNGSLVYSSENSKGVVIAIKIPLSLR